MSKSVLKPTILVVDDVPQNIDILAEALDADYDVKVALNGESALDISFSENPPDLILLDIMMPGMDGYEVCHQLKKEPGTRDIPVIFVTAMGEVEDEAKGFDVGSVDYITKPVSIPRVLARVRAHLELKQAREDLKKQNEILKENLRLREDVDSIIRHDLKTPLNVVMWVPDLLQDEDNLSQKQIKTLNILKQAGYNMLNIINSSINLIKMERGEYELHPMPVNILNVLRKIRSEMYGLIQSKGLEINILVNGNTEKESDVLLFDGEELLFQSMLSNLIKNAFEASPFNEVITVSIDENDDRTIRIHNKGEVPLNIRERFFDKYITSKGKGAGLGTYSARLMAETQNGIIHVDTSKPSETSILIVFPKGKK
ncbi:MAG: response regulator [Desulfobacteraceae bacterium]|jgi:CheY-like chemotaxis protein